MCVIHKYRDIILIVSLENKFFRHLNEIRIIVHSKKETVKLWGKIFPTISSNGVNNNL